MKTSVCLIYFFHDSRTWWKHIEQHLVAFRKLLMETLYWETFYYLQSLKNLNQFSSATTKYLLKNVWVICELFQLGTNKQLKNVGQAIKTQIKFHFEETQRTPIWWITLKSWGNVDLLPTLNELLSYTIFNEAYEHEITSKKSRLISSIVQNTCHAAKQGKWKLPKHAGPGMAVIHLFRSKELMTFLNRFRHFENYSFIVGLEIAIANQLEKISSLITNEIVKNPTSPDLFHSDFDNFE